MLASSEEEANAKALARKFEQKYRAARTLQATFLERYLDNGRLVRVESGVAYFRRPGKMRWEYESPEKNVFLVDGKTAWFYVPTDHTVTRVPARDSSDWRTPLALLAGEMKLSRVCASVGPAPGVPPQAQQNAVLSCSLRGAGSVSEQAEGDQEVVFEIVKGSGELLRVAVKYPGDIEIEFQFANWRTNPALPESLFQFEPPRGVAIVNGELPQAPAGASR